MEKRLPGENTTLETRVESELTVDKEKRYKQILDVLSNKEMTAKEIANEMWMREIIPTNERNFVSPRLTELTNAGKVEPIGKKLCYWTNKKVTVTLPRATDASSGYSHTQYSYNNSEWSNVSTQQTSSVLASAYWESERNLFVPTSKSN